MYTSSYKHRPAGIAAFEDAYVKEAFMKSHQNEAVSGLCHTNSGKENFEEVNEQITPPAPCKPKKDNSGILSGIDGGDILLVLLILFFLADKDSENDTMLPVLLSLLLLF